MSSNTSTIAPTTSVAPAAPLTLITPFRALFLILAKNQGWDYFQILTSVDQYRKGDEVITIKWGTTQMVEYLHTKGGKVAPNGDVKGGAAAKMQKLQHQAFKVKEAKATSLKDTNWKWAKLTDSKRAELSKLALATFKIKEA